MKEFFKFYFFLMGVIALFLFLLASTLGLAAVAIVLACYFENGFWCLLLLGEIFTIPLAFSIIYFMVE